MPRRGKRGRRDVAAPQQIIAPSGVGLKEMNAALAAAGLPPATLGKSGGDPFSGKRTVDIKIVAPGVLQNGRLSNPDPILQQFGGWGGICLYDRMERQNGYYAGAVNLQAERVCAIDRTWKAGDESEGKSREMRDNQIKLYRKLPDLHILNKKMVKGRMYGYAATGKADWRIDEETGVYAPHDLYDIHQRYLKFGPNGEAYRVTAYSSQGDLIDDQRSIFYYRWGSRFTAYGEGDAQLCYLPNWYMQTVRDFGMGALEILGRPIPWAEVPMDLVGDEYNKFEDGLKKQYKFYVISRSNTNHTTISFPTAPILANRSAGGSELEFLRWYLGEIYVCVLGVQMTQDSSGGSRALESTRLEVISDKTPAASQALDQAWTSGYSNHIWEINEPKVPRAWYPRCESDTDSASTALSGSQVASLVDISAAIALRQMSAVYATKTIQGTGIPESWARAMVDSMFNERDQLNAPPRAADRRSESRVQQLEAMDAADADENKAKAGRYSIPTESGKVLNFESAEQLVPVIGRGWVPIDETVNGDELKTLKG